jgi:hypothetical protein
MLDDRRSSSMLLVLVLLITVIDHIGAFVVTDRHGQRRKITASGAPQAHHGWIGVANRSASPFFQRSLRLSSTPQSTPSTTSTSEKGDWDGNVVPTNQGKIEGCTVQANGETEWTITIDGVEADLGKFGLAIYKKIITDAKQQRFQGFRPGTIPPFLETTYRAYCMDECARETVLEALQQNNIRPFESCRTDMELYDFTIPPAAKAATPKKKQKKTSRKKKKDAADGDGDVAVDAAEEEQQPAEIIVEAEPQWRSFATMKETIDAGWQPGQSFSFRARKVRGQQVRPDDRGRTLDPLTGRLA